MRRSNKLAIAIALALTGPTGWVCAQSAPPPANAPSTSGDTVDTSGPATLPILDWAVGLGYEHTDNINRTSIDPTSQDILQPTINFAYTQRGSTLQAQATGVIQYVDYLQNFYGNEFRGQLSGTLNWIIAPHRLNFELQDYSSVEPVSIRAANAPSNQQQVNVFVAGPTLSFRMGSALRGEADLRYVNTTASKTKDFNSQRGLGAFRAIRDLSPTDTLSFNAEAVHVDFSNVDPLVNPNRYNQYNGYLRYQSNLRRVDLYFSLGGSRTTFSQGLGTHSGALVRAGVSWRMSPRNLLQVNASDQLADSTANLIEAPSLTAPDVTALSVQVGRTAISPVVYRDQSLDLSYGFQGPRLGFTLTPFYVRLRQLNGNDLSRNGYGTIAGISYLLRPLMTLGFTAEEQTTKYTSDHSRDRDTSYTVNLARQFTQHWSWSVALNHQDRNSTRPGFDYHENQVFLILFYRR
jgi:hypothetical protein